MNVWPESVEEARRRLARRPDGRGAIHVGDGELRAGVGCYSVLPPSTHPSGHVYGWTVPLPNGDLPWIDACDAAFFEPPEIDPIHCGNTEHTGNTSNSDKSEGGRREHDGDAMLAPPIVVAELTVEEAIAGSLPTQPGQINRFVFELARRLKAVPALRNEPGPALRRYARAWHQRAYAVISTKPFEETWIDFLKAWANVRTPYGGGVLNVTFEAARLDPPLDLVHEYTQPEIGLLARLCRRLQQAAAERPFFLSCRDAGRLLEVSHVQASRWLFLLVADGVLEEVEKGDLRRHRASLYRCRT